MGLISGLAAAGLATLLGSAVAYSCPASQDDPLWLQAGCDISRDQLPDLKDRVLELEATQGQSGWNLLEVLIEEHYVATLDWEFASEDILWNFENIIAAAGLAPLTSEEIGILTKVGDAEWGTSVPIVGIEPHFEKAVRKRGGRLLYIDTQSDSYTYAIVTPLVECKWMNVTLAEELTFTKISPDSGLMSYNPAADASDKPNDCRQLAGQS